MNNSSTICVDANIVVRLVLFPKDKIQTIWQDWTSNETRLAAPSLLYYEVVNSLYQYQKHGKNQPCIVGGRAPSRTGFTHRVDRR